MQLVSFLKRIPGFDVRTQKLGTTTTVSITGSAKTIGYTLQLALETGLFMIDQIMRYGIRMDGNNAHLVLAEDPKCQLSQDNAKKLTLLDGYDYAHQVTAMAKGVNIAIFDKDFTPDASTGKAFGQFASGIFEDGKIRGTDTNTLVLLGRSTKDRVFVASMRGKKYPLQIVTQAINGNIRYSTCQNDTLLAVEYGTGTIAALHVDQIVKMFDNGTVPSWKILYLRYIMIEDITQSIGASQTVAITATIDGKRKLVAANFNWCKHDGRRTFTLTLVEAYAIDMPIQTAPVVRLTRNTVITVNANGTNAPWFANVDINNFGNSRNAAALRRMATDAASGKISKYTTTA